MSRVRLDTPVRGSRPSATSSERIDTNTRPPADLIPPVFADLIAEYDALNTEHAAAERAVDGFSYGWDAQLDAAKAADAQDNARAVRADPHATTNTTAADALVKARDDTRARLASLTDARRAIVNDFYTLMGVEQSNPAYAKATDLARAALLKTAAPLQAAVTRAVQAQALYEWIHAQQWDQTEAIRAVDLCPAVLNLGPGAESLRPVTAGQIITALTQIAD